MALENKYKNQTKYKGKIKIRNLDPEVISLINKGGSSGGSGYDDTEIREDISNIQETLETHDNLINNINTKISSAATKTELNQFRRKDIDITYNDLDSDLKEKINNNGSSGSEDVDLSDITNQIKELQSKVSINIGNIDNNASNINILSDLFNTYKIESLNKDTEQDNLINSNTNKIRQLENTIKDSIGSDIDISDLSDELANKINQIDNINNDLSSVSQQVENNTFNINNNYSNIIHLQKDLTTLDSNISQNINIIFNDLSTTKNDIMATNKDILSLTIDKIISFSDTSIDPDNGKINEENLTSELISKINNANNISNDIEQIRDTIAYPGKNVNGDNLNFIYKNGDYLSTKYIFYFIGIAENESELSELQKQNNINLIYDHINNIFYTKVFDEDENTTKDFSWKEIENSLLNNEYNFSLMLDIKRKNLYFNNNGDIQKILTANDTGNWYFSSIEENLLQLKYKDVIIQEWGIEDSINNLQSSSLLDNSINNSIINTISANNFEDIVLSPKQIINSKILILDNRKNSISSGFYIEANNNLCTIVYKSNGIRIYNTNNFAITVKIIY